MIENKKTLFDFRAERVFKIMDTNHINSIDNAEIRNISRKQWEMIIQIIILTKNSNTFFFWIIWKRGLIQILEEFKLFIKEWYIIELKMKILGKDIKIRFKFD